MQVKTKQLILALDTTNENTAVEMINKVSHIVHIFKVGKGLFVKAGPQIIKTIQKLGGQVFLDLKFHDIPYQVSLAVKSAVDHGVFMTTIHTSGGLKMMEAAAEAKGNSAIKLIGITVLTSINNEDLSVFGIPFSTNELVIKMAKLAYQSGLNGVVASPREVRDIKKSMPENFLVVTPGIRPKGSSVDDQARTDTPSEAIKAGSDYLVIGRPIFNAPDPAAAALSIIREIENEART